MQGFFSIDEATDTEGSKSSVRPAEPTDGLRSHLKRLLRELVTNPIDIPKEIKAARERLYAYHKLHHRTGKQVSLSTSPIRLMRIRQREALKNVPTEWVGDAAEAIGKHRSHGQRAKNTGAVSEELYNQICNYLARHHDTHVTLPSLASAWFTSYCESFLKVSARLSSPGTKCPPVKGSIDLHRAAALAVLFDNERFLHGWLSLAVEAQGDLTHLKSIALADKVTSGIFQVAARVLKDFKPDHQILTDLAKYPLDLRIEWLLTQWNQHHETAYFISTWCGTFE